MKIGHGGTLDPKATGVLILGVGSGTKSLSRFLECTKSYEAVVLFGAATDSYDSVGKIVARKPYDHVTKEVVEEALSKFRGKFLQQPPIFSALRVQGKRLYEYAREGKEVPVEIEERPVEVENLEMVEWLEGGTHEYRWPDEEAGKEEKAVAEKVLHLDGGTEAKRKREDDLASIEAHPKEQQSSPKRYKPSPETVALNASQTDARNASDETDSRTNQPSNSITDKSTCLAPACRLRMTVASGFYVRSLCHDLGAAVNSLGLMASLVRTRQADFELGKNVLDYEDLPKGEDVWGPKIKEMLTEWNEREEADGRGVDEDQESKQVVQGPREAKPKMRARLRASRSENGE